MTPPPTKVFLHYLDRLDGLLRHGAGDGAVAWQRLHPDMFPLLQQAKTAIGFALRTVCPLAGREIVSFDDGQPTLDSAFAQLDATRRYLEAIPDGAFDALAERTIATTAGFAELRLSGWDYYLLYALPNFFFHYCMVYAIARQAGLPIGKPDFDGFHQYPPGFAFPVLTSGDVK